MAAAGGHQGFARAEIWQGGHTTLADEVKGQHIRPAAEPFADITRQPRAQIARAGADDEGIDFVRPVTGIGQRAFRGLGCEQRQELYKNPHCGDFVRL